MLKLVMLPEELRACSMELEKIARRGIVELLSSKAMKQGISPKQIPAIKQVGSIASSGDRQRAAQVAGNVRRFLGTKSTQVA